MSQSLATTADAQLILKLYELRTEPVMRDARRWITETFWPASSDEVLVIFSDMSSSPNQYLRQVTSYWEMAASFVLHGALSPELFLDCNGEPLFIYAKFEPYLGRIRERMPQFLAKTGALVERYPSARATVDRLRQMMDARKTEPAR